MWWMIALALGSDPAALRATPGPGVAIDYGLEQLSVGYRTPDSLVFGGNLRPNAYVGAWVGGSRRLVGPDRPWGVDGAISGGVDALFQTPAALLTANASLRAGVTGDRGLASLGLVVPSRIGVVPIQPPAASVLLEPRFGVRAGPVTFGWRGQMGSVFWAGHTPALVIGHGVWMAWQPGTSDRYPDSASEPYSAR